MTCCAGFRYNVIFEKCGWVRDWVYGVLRRISHNGFTLQYYSLRSQRGPLVLHARTRLPTTQINKTLVILLYGLTLIICYRATNTKNLRVLSSLEKTAMAVCCASTRGHTESHFDKQLFAVTHGHLRSSSRNMIWHLWALRSDPDS